MKHSITRTAGLLLILSLLFALLVPFASAAELTEVQQALNETALAYFYKGANIQYDSTNITAQGAGRSTCGESRMNNEAPEFASPDHTVYSVCSDYCYNIYLDTLGYELMSTPRKSITNPMSSLPVTDPQIIYKWRGGDGVEDAAQAMQESRAILQPGDLIIGYNENKSSGHAMYFAGDIKGDGQDYILHCNGKKVDLKTGADAVDNEKYGNGGAIRMETPEALCYGEKSIIHLTTAYTRFVIMRPTLAADFAGHTLTDHAKARLKYKGIQVDKNADITVYQSPVTGQDIQITLTVTNNGKDDFKGVAVSEPLPVGATLKAGSVTGGGQVGDKDITWTIDVPAGQKTELTYTITVTAKRLEEVTVPGGKVDGLDTRSLVFKVGGAKLSQDKIDTLFNLNKKDYKERRANITVQDVAFANAIYEEFLGLDLGLPAEFNDMMQNTFNKITPVNLNSSYSGMWQLKPLSEITGKYRMITDMGIREHLVGFTVYTGKDPQEVTHSLNPVNRTTDYKESFYEPGDVFICLDAPDTLTASKKDNIDILVYLGTDKVAYWTSKGIDISSFKNTIGRAYRYNVVLALRPTMGFDDINTVKAEKLPFTDVKSADWFYTYVKDLFKEGTVNGMTDTTFVPNGKLTYGQALKLIVCGLGKGEQAATGSHWASGYLAFAKNQKWLDTDVDLNGAISRLQFCQIAAKAKGLTEQPASNPFKDCADKDVLALVNAGIINGMSADTFAPDDTLTRAQISKIIWCMTDRK